MNRRLGILCLLYHQRRIRPDSPGLSVLQLETIMAFPREHLCFALWYLKEKKYTTQLDNSDVALTAAGVDYVESVSQNPLVARLLNHQQESCKPAAEELTPNSSRNAWDNVTTARRLSAHTA